MIPLTLEQVARAVDALGGVRPPAVVAASAPTPARGPTATCSSSSGSGSTRHVRAPVAGCPGAAARLAPGPSRTSWSATPSRRWGGWRIAVPGPPLRRGRRDHGVGQDDDQGPARAGAPGVRIHRRAAWVSLNTGSACRCFGARHRPGTRASSSRRWMRRHRPHPTTSAADRPPRRRRRRGQRRHGAYGRVRSRRPSLRRAARRVPAVGRTAGRGPQRRRPARRRAWPCARPLASSRTASRRRPTSAPSTSSLDDEGGRRSRGRLVGGPQRRRRPHGLHGRHVSPTPSLRPPSAPPSRLDLDEVAAALSAAVRRVVGGWRSTGPSGATVVNDAYNANPDSVRAALQALAAMTRDGRRNRGAGEMFELRRPTVDLHEETGAGRPRRCAARLAGRRVGRTRPWPGTPERRLLGDVGASPVRGAGREDSADVVLVKASRVGRPRTARGVIVPRTGLVIAAAGLGPSSPARRRCSSAGSGRRLAQAIAVGPRRALPRPRGKRGTRRWAASRSSPACSSAYSGGHLSSCWRR